MATRRNQELGSDITSVATGQPFDPLAPPSLLLGFLGLLVSLTALCFAAEAFARRVLHLRFDPYYHPFHDHYPDFTLFQPRFQHFGTTDFFTFTSPTPFLYPAPVAVVYQFFYGIPGHPLRAFLLFVLLAFFIPALFLLRALIRGGLSLSASAILIVLTLLCAYPVWFDIVQANMEVAIWVLVTSGVFLFLRRQGYAAAVCFGLAASMKIYPLIYLALFLRRRQFRLIVTGAAVLVLSTIASLWLVSPSIGLSWRYISHGVDTFRIMYMLHLRPEIGFDHSLFALGKRMLHPLPPPGKLSRLLTGYLVGAALSGVAVFFLRIRNLPLINQVLCLTLACILLPPTSFEYTLIHLLLPLSLLSLLAVDLARSGRTLPGLVPVFLSIALLLAPLPEIIHGGHRWGGQFKAVILLALFVLALRYPFPSRNFADWDDLVAYPQNPHLLSPQ